MQEPLVRRVEASLRLVDEASGMRRQVEEERRGARKGEREASTAGSNTREWGELEEAEPCWDERIVLAI